VLDGWIALGILVLTIIVSAIGIVAVLFKNKNVILAKMTQDKEAIDIELMGIRLSAFEEYKTVRKEINELASISRKEFGETILAMREKLTQIELWVRDQLSDTRHTLVGGMDMRHSIALEMIEKMQDRLRALELLIAGQGIKKSD